MTAIWIGMEQNHCKANTMDSWLRERPLFGLQIKQVQAILISTRKFYFKLPLCKIQLYKKNGFI